MCKEITIDIDNTINVVVDYFLYFHMHITHILNSSIFRKRINMHAIPINLFLSCFALSSSKLLHIPLKIRGIRIPVALSNRYKPS